MDNVAEKTNGEINFDAYVQAVGGSTYDDKPIPKWEDLPEKVRGGWNAGAAAVIERYDPEGLIDELNGDDDDSEEDLDDDDQGGG